MRKIKVLVITVTLLLIGSLAFAQGQYQLDAAKATMERGDYRLALSQFNDISRNPMFSRAVMKEAAYYLGFCYVKMSDPWSAIRAYQDFLDRFDSSSYDTNLIPDAMYVLGRTYEEVRDFDRASAIYRRCLDRFPIHPMAGKAEERLRILGGGYNNGGNHGGGHDHGGYGNVTPEIADLVDLAKTSSNSYSRDEMLMKAAKKARTGADFKLIMDATNNDYTKGEILSVARNSTVFGYMTINEIVLLARSTNNSYNRDEFLLAAAKKVARTARDFKELAEATSNSYTRQQILDIASNVIGRSNNNMLSMDVAEAKPAKTVKTVASGKTGKSKVDPFDQFTPDRVKIQRVSQFLDAIKKRSNIEAAAKKLAKEDASLEVVKSAMQEYHKVQQFNTLHQGK